MSQYTYKNGYDILYAFSQTPDFRIFETNIAASLKTVQNKYKQLCAMCESLNEVYSLQLLLIFIRSLLSQLCAVFFLVQHQWKSTLTPNVFVLYLCGLFLLNFAHIWGITLFCAATVNEVRAILSKAHLFILISTNIDFVLGETKRIYITRYLLYFN